MLWFNARTEVDTYRKSYLNTYHVMVQQYIGK